MNESVGSHYYSRRSRFVSEPLGNRRSPRITWSSRNVAPPAHPYKRGRSQRIEARNAGSEMIGRLDFEAPEVTVR